MQKNSRYVCLIAILLISIVIITPAANGGYGSYPYPGDDWAWTMVGADMAMELGASGRGVRIAILDTGIDYNHPDLKDRMWDGIGYDFVNKHNDPMDNDGHGTHVAGIIASVAPEAELMALKVIEEEGGRWQEVAQAIRFARENDADIISMSFGSGPGIMTRAFEIQMNQAYLQDGILLIAAAGNRGTDEKQYPAGYDSVVGVSALNHLMEKTDYSSYGDWIELTAPGGDTEKGVFSTLPGGSYGYKSGTSMAAPFVTGVAAVMLGTEPSLTGQEVRARLREEAICLGDFQYYGHGLVNGYMATGARGPSYPENVRGSSGNGYASIYWDIPRYHGISSIEGYKVYRHQEEGDPELVGEVGANSTYFTDEEVFNDITYRYTVTAFNDYEEGMESRDIFLTPREKPVEPSAVRDLRVISREVPVKIQWNVPMDDGGSPVTHYSIYRDGNFIGEVTDTWYLDHYPGKEAMYAVSASNNVGEGELSEPVRVSVMGWQEDTGWWTILRDPVVWIFVAVGLVITYTFMRYIPPKKREQPPGSGNIYNSPHPSETKPPRCVKDD